jgi:hypothetical protein
MQSQVYEFLVNVANGASGEVVMDSNTIALQTGVPRDTVNKVLFNLSHHGKIELVRGKNGRTIEGYKLLMLPGERRPRRQAEVVPTRERLDKPVMMTERRSHRSSILTPALDQYANAKERFSRLTEDFGDLVEMSFKANEYAEEGLKVVARLSAIEADLIETRRELEECNRSLRALRDRQTKEVAAKAAGAMVEHSSNN